MQKGLEHLERSDVAALAAASPKLAAAASLSEIRQEIRSAAAGLEMPRNGAALALLRATAESRSMGLESARRLTRVKLGEVAADARVPVARQRGKKPEELTDLELIAALRPAESAVLRRPPSPDRRPGDAFYLLREVHDALCLGHTESVDTVRAPGLEPPELSGPIAADRRQRPRVAAVGGLAVADPPSTPARLEASEAAIESLRQLISAHFGTHLELTRFARGVLSAHEALENLSISVELLDGDETFFTFRVVREFKARFSRYVVGVAVGDEARAALIRCLPELRELIWLPPETPDLDTAVDELIEGGLLEIRNPRSASGYRSARFAPLAPDDDLLAQLAEHAEVDEDTVRLLAVEVGGEAELAQYRSSLDMRLARARRRCAWFVDGPVFIDRIRIDLRGFADAAESGHTNVYFFVPGTESYSSSTELERRHFEREVHDWALRQHGFAIHW